MWKGRRLRFFETRVPKIHVRNSFFTSELRILLTLSIILCSPVLSFVLPFSLSFLALFVPPTRFASNNMERRGHLVCNFRANVKLYAWASVLLLLPVWMAGWRIDQSSHRFHQAWVANRCVASSTGVIIPGYGHLIAVANAIFTWRATSRK